MVNARVRFSSIPLSIGNNAYANQRKGHTMPKQNTVKVIGWTADTHPTKGRYAGMTKHDTLHLSVDASGVEIKHADMPDYVLKGLLAGRTVKINKYASPDSVYQTMLAKVQVPVVEKAAGKPAKKVIATRTVAENIEILRMLATPDQLNAFVDSLNV